MPGLFLLVVLGLLAAGAPSAAARDLATRLTDAEAKAAQYESELPALQSDVSIAEDRYGAAAHRAAPVVRSLHQTQAEAQRLRHELAARQQAAKAHINRLEEQHRHEVDDHDEEVRSGVGFGLAALVAGLIALAWGWFRATAPVAALTRIDLVQAIGICVGGGLLLLIVGAVLGSSNGAVGALGSFLFCLGLILPAAFLLARHSAEIQRGRAKPLLRRERLPHWVSLATAGLMFVLFLAGTGSALFASGASSAPITPRLEGEAEAVSEGPGAEELQAVKGEAAKARQRAAAPLAARARAGHELASARRELRHAQQHLAAAKASQRSFSRQLVALEAREQRQAEKEAARLQREEEKRIAEEEQEAEEQLASECDPNYSGCLDPNASDYDCAGGSGDGPLYTGTVEVIGEDHYGLDSDGDGIGCESE